MKKHFLTLASLMMMIGLIGATQVGAAAAKPSGQTTHATHAVRIPAKFAELNSGKRLSAHELKALGLKPVSHKQAARINRLRHKTNGRAKAAEVGSTYWYTWQNAGFSWVDTYYDYDYYSSDYSWFITYDNYKTCDLSGYNCIDAHAYVVTYYLYYYGAEYVYGPYGPYGS